MVLTTEIIVFIGVVIAAVISIVIYLNSIDKRVTVLESKALTKDEFHEKMDEVKETLSDKIESEIKKCSCNK